MKDKKTYYVVIPGVVCKKIRAKSANRAAVKVLQESKLSRISTPATGTLHVLWNKPVHAGRKFIYVASTDNVSVQECQKQEQIS